MPTGRETRRPVPAKGGRRQLNVWRPLPRARAERIQSSVLPNHPPPSLFEPSRGRSCVFLFLSVFPSPKLPLFCVRGPWFVMAQCILRKRKTEKEIDKKHPCGPAVALPARATRQRPGARPPTDSGARGRRPSITTAVVVHREPTHTKARNGPGAARWLVPKACFPPPPCEPRFAKNGHEA
jgi:hypothetical protein